ncbi:MAG: choice-of-anchor tandem repeat GloVer-containing protein [Candidatus Korobacteraceae bacterium]|jgi:uncharacterized repeat protein (TIGR03803 family)
MHGKSHSHSPIFGISWSPANTAVTALLTILILTLTAQAQTFSVIHNFTGGADGAGPFAGVTIAPSGVLYGTAAGGGTGGTGNGTVFKMARHGSSWTFDPLYEFTGASDGGTPYGGVVIGPNGALYGTTYGGGLGGGTAYELRPSPSFCRAVECYWNERVLHAFTFTGLPGTGPLYENLIFDRAGNIYGTTTFGGIYGLGTVFELSPSGGEYTESILHNFGSGLDGQTPYSGVIFDAAGNLYGNTVAGGTEEGTVYQLIPSGGAWVENILANLGDNTGHPPEGTLIFDQSGNLFGTGFNFGPGGGGTVYELAHGNWVFSLPYYWGSNPACYPQAGLTLGADGNLYGVCSYGGSNDDGWVFKLTNSNGMWTITDLHDFDGSDGIEPAGAVAFDASGNLFGTCVEGGNTNCSGFGCGTVWEMTGVIGRE